MNTETFVALFEDQFARYPEMDLLDIYVLLYQCAYGPSYLVADATQAYDHLIEDARKQEGIEPLEQEDVIEILDPELELARVNLRGYLRAGGALQRLYKALTTTVASFEPRPGLLPSGMAALIHWLDQSEEVYEFSANECRDFFKTMMDENYPPRPHSQEYRSAYKPCYRVLCLGELN